MVDAKTKYLDQSAIPVIDIAELYSETNLALRRVADEMRRAAESIGFFYVTNHGIPQAQIARAFEIAHHFFGSLPEQKAHVAVNAFHRGFLRIGEAKMYDGARADLKESFVWGLELDADRRAELRPDTMIGRNVWPDFLPEMQSVLVSHLESCNKVGWLLLRAFATGLGISHDYFVRTTDRPLSRGSLIYYPPQPPELGEKQFGVAPHTDYGCLTLLCQDDAGGLQVRNADGDWVTALPIADTFVVNVGDLLARWTNDRFASTPHRVINRSGRERFSVAVFVDPNEETIIEPVVPQGEKSHYDPVTCAAYIRSRYDAAFSYRRAKT
jgi:isopenicillin N synthase-like dioxygenase